MKRKVSSLESITRPLGDSLLRNAFHLFGVNLLPGVIGSAFWMIAGHLYTPAEIGLAASVISATILVSGIAGPGFNLGIIRFLPQSPRPTHFLNVVYTSILALGVGFGVAFLAGIQLWSPRLSLLRDDLWLALLFIVFVVVVDLGAVVRETFVACRQSQYALGYTLIANIGRIVFILAAWRLGVSGIVVAFLLGYALALFAAWARLPRVVSGYRALPDWDWALLKSITPFSFGNYLVTFLGQINQTILPLMILAVSGAWASGTAYIPLMLGALLVTPGLALAMSAFAEGTNQQDRSTAIFTRAVKLAMPVTLAIAAIAMLAAPWILLLFGAAYNRESLALFRWLALASIPIVINQLYCSWLRVQNRTWWLVLFSAFITGFILAGVYAFLPSFGILSIGVITLIANCIAIVFMTADLFRVRM
jgi:O-antigen/teichoic acid export membrane protein